MESFNRDPYVDKKMFYQCYMPEILEESGRVKYYKDYEFAKKQTNLLQYWRRALNLYLKHYLKGFAVHWSDLIDFFDVSGTRPLGLAKIILELSKNKELVILKDESEFKKVSRSIGNQNIEEESSGSFWKGVFNFFLKTNENLMSESTIIVHAAYATNAFNRAKASIKSIFEDKILIEENDFISKFGKALDLNTLDQKILLQLLLDNRVVYKLKEKKKVFYCLEEPGPDNKLQVDIEKEEVLLNGRINQLDEQITMLTRNIETKTREALEFKRKNKKTQAMNRLTELRNLKANVEKLRTERIFIENIKYKLVHTHNQKELADVLKDVNKILSDHEHIYDEIIKNHDEINDFEIQNEQINQVITNANKDNDLEDMYKDLNDLSVSRIVNPERIRNLSAEEERKDSSTSEVMRKNSQKLKESTLKDINNLTESQLLLKRFTNFEE